MPHSEDKRPTLIGDVSGVLDFDDAGDSFGLFCDRGLITDGGSLLLPHDVPVDGFLPWSLVSFTGNSSSSEIKQKIIVKDFILQRLNLYL